uniref:Centromere protein Cenp-F N-terminal domain-containing protein n=1 Tax=Strigops habroptila TaxID=2489341 RepID=A0A672TZE7_STRHB
MSWAVEEWKEGISPRVLQKIHELESQVDKLRKERQQRQFQLESLEAALQKQKQKVTEALCLNPFHLVLLLQSLMKSPSPASL